MFFCIRNTNKSTYNVSKYQYSSIHTKPPGKAWRRYVHVSRILSAPKCWVIIYLGCMLPHISCSTLRPGNYRYIRSCRARVRPCTQVRILPFHLWCYHQSYSRRNPFAFAPGVSARTSTWLAARFFKGLKNLTANPATGVTRYPATNIKLVRVRTFLSVQLYTAITVPHHYAT